MSGLRLTGSAAGDQFRIGALMQQAILCDEPAGIVDQAAVLPHTCLPRSLNDHRRRKDRTARAVANQTAAEIQ